MRRLLITFILLSFWVHSFGQFQINATLNFFDFDELNQELALNQFPIFDNEAYTFEAFNTTYDNEDSKVGTRNGFLYTLFETEGDPTNLGTPNSTRDVDMRSIGFFSGLEIPIIKNKIITLAPSLDFILSQQRLRVSKNFPSNTTFGNLIGGDPEVETFRNIRLMFDGRINLLLHFPTRANKATYGIGLTGGYRLDPWTPTWKFERLEKVEIDGSKQNGFHIGLTLTIKFPKINPPPLPKKREQRS